jgi:hypothetical protein
MRKLYTWITLTLTLLVVLILTMTVMAQTGSDYDLSWWTVDGGGGTSSGGLFSLSGTSGKPDAGFLSGGIYTLNGGFWGSGEITTPEYTLFLPLILR